MILGHLFAVPLAEERMPEAESLNKELTRIFLEAEEAGDQYRNEIRRDTQHGALFESRFDLFRWEQPSVRKLAAFCHGALAQVVAELSDYNKEELGQLKFDYHAWFHVTRKGGYQGLHNHQNASWSGIYCVDPGEPVADRPDSGVVRFHDPRANANYYLDAGNSRLKMPAHHGVYEVRHEAGKLLIFPSYLNHEIFAYAGDRPRIVVAFNCWIGMQR